MIQFWRGLKLLSLSLVVLLSACEENNLDTLKGPKSGKVSGLMCNDLDILLAARDTEIVRNAMLENGKCKSVRYAKEVQVSRTIMMPTDGKYSQIQWPTDNKKYWVRTDKIK